MKKLITLLLVLTGMVTTASADGITVYMKAGDWANENAGLAVWVNASWVEFENISDDYYKAQLPANASGNIVLVRYNPANSAVTSGWDNKGVYNQSQDISVSSLSTYNFFKWTDWHNGGGVYSNSSFDWLTAHKIYVKNLQTADAPTFNDNALTTETVGEESWYVYLNLSGNNSITGHFAAGDDTDSGDITFDLSSSDVYYNYYPTNNQAVLTSEALASPARVYFRANNGENTLYYYFWNNEGINPAAAFTTATAGGVNWMFIETYKPTFSIRFYTYNNGNGDDDQTDDSYSNYTFTSGETAYYFANLGSNVLKKAAGYSVLYSPNWNYNDENVVVGMTPSNTNSFEYKADVTVTEGKWLYFNIFPTADLSGNTVTSAGWNEMVSPYYKVNDSYTSDNHYDLASFEAYSCATNVKNYNRWYIQGVNAKHEIVYNFATQTWTCVPSVEAEVTAKGYATYSKGSKYSIGDATAYVVEAIGDDGATLTTLEANTVLPANAGIILEGEGSHPIYAVTWDATTRDNSANLLVGTGDSELDLSDVSNAFIFADGAKGVGFYKFKKDEVTADNNKLAANKAYLNGASLNPARMFVGFDTESTGISEIQNNEVFNGAIYNLQGVRLNKFQKGLNIVNGKKVMVK